MDKLRDTVMLQQLPYCTRISCWFVSESICACDRRSIRYSSELECDTFTPQLDILFWFVF